MLVLSNVLNTRAPFDFKPYQPFYRKYNAHKDIGNKPVIKCPHIKACIKTGVKRSTAIEDKKSAGV